MAVLFGKMISRGTIALFVIAAIAIACCCEARKLHKHHGSNVDDSYNEVDTSVGGGGGGGFVEVRGIQFVLNGSPFLFNGFNSYWMMNVATEPADRSKVSSVFREASPSAGRGHSAMAVTALCRFLPASTTSVSFRYDIYFNCTDSTS